MVDDGIFISYRRDRGSEVARICKEFLEGQGFRVFLDVDGLTNGPFDSQLLEQLDRHGHLLLVCSPGCLDRCSENNDWIRQEVAHAIKLKRNIVPLVLSEFKWPESETLPEEIRELTRHNAFSYFHEHWDLIKGEFANRFRTGKLAVQTLPERFIQVFMPQLLKLMANRKGDVVPAQTESDFFKVASENLLGGSSQGETRQMLEEIVQHPSKFANAVSAATANQSVDVQDAAKLYFGQVPGTLQQSLRRSGDRTGRTIPNDLPLSKPEDFLRLIPSAMPRFMPGQFPVTGTDLKLIAFLGKGGFGEVWRARHLDRPNDADVVLKFCIDERAARSLIKEVDLLKKIKTKGRHANIVDLLDTHLDCSPPCLEYEFVDGGDLAKLIDDRSMNPLTPKLSPKAVAQIIARIATPVAFAHQQNIVHRDLKPQNVLVRRTQSDLNSVNFKITDFGIGGLIRTEELKQIQTSSVSAGETLSKGTFTPIYSSRQQQQGASPDKRDDVFALGVIWYQLLINDLTKEAPSGGGWKVRLRANGVTDEMLALLEGCIESDLEDRIPDAQILVERLTKIISAKPVEAPIAQPVVAPPVQLSTMSLEWAEILERHPDSAVVGGQFIEKIRATGLPWRVRDKATGIEMLIVPSGIFEMGQSVGEPFNRADELPRHTVRISRPFYLGRYPVTQEEWCRVGKINPSAAKSPRNPVEKISWTDANDYCKQAGLRLPTEAEWEYSCRAGSTGVSYGELEQIGWYSGNSQKLTRQVGMKLANALGFHDMIGLVWEWCSDFYASDYYASCASGVDDPQGPIGGGAHVQRGGSFGNRAVMCRPAVRTSPRTDARLKYHGFRVVREPYAVVAHEVHKKASATPGPTVPSVPPARPARPVAPPPFIRPQKPSSVGTPEQANNNVRAVESASKYVQKIDAIRAENDASINAENEASNKAEKNAAVSRTLGIAGLICFVVPVLGLIMPSWGIVCAVKGINSQKRSQAVAGLRMCILGLLFSLILNVIYIGIIKSNPQEGQSSKSPKPSSSTSWSFTVLEQDPDPTVVTDAAACGRMTATRLPWKIRDTATGIVMLLVPPGEFMMGSPQNEAGRYYNETQHRVTISKAFYLSQTEIPQEVWQKVMGANPSEFNGSQNPVETVSWNDCQAFCGATGLRLPSEAEWEYACRAGTTTPFSFGATITTQQVHNEGFETAVCGSLPANQWGFREMHGNVMEWCQDGNSEAASTTQAAVETKIGVERAARGGGWSYSAGGCRASTRYFRDPAGVPNSFIGCRFARTAD